MNYIFPLYSQRCNVLKLTEKFVAQVCKHRPESHGTQHMRQVAKNAQIIASVISSLYCIGLYIGLYIGIMTFATIINQYMYINPFIYILLIIGIYINRIIYLDPDGLVFIVQLIAWLHDVDDHKYHADDLSISVKLDNFLKQITQEYHMVLKGSVYEYLYNKKMILRIIKLISFSRQKKNAEDTNDWNVYLGTYGTFVRNIVSDADKLEALGLRGFNRCVEYTKEIFYKNQINFAQTNIVIAVKKHYNEKLSILATQKYMKTLPGYLYSLYLNKVLMQLIKSMKCDLKRPFVSSNKDMMNLTMSHCTHCVKKWLKKRFPDTYQMLENMEKTGYLCTTCGCKKKHLDKLTKLVNLSINPAYLKRPSDIHDCPGCEENAHYPGSTEWNYVVKTKIMYNDLCTLCDLCESFYHRNIIVQPSHVWNWIDKINGINIQPNISLITLKDRVLGFVNKYRVNTKNKTINICLDCNGWNPSYSIKAYGALKYIKSCGFSCIKCIWLHKQKENIKFKERGIKKIYTISYCTKCYDYHLTDKERINLIKLEYMGFKCTKCKKYNI
jgi:hypothetical protein